MPVSRFPEKSALIDTRRTLAILASRLRHRESFEMLRSRSLSTCALFVLLAAAAAHAEPASVAGRRAASLRDAASAEPAASGRAAFRLGNAARPFGWSTVIGDFDTDGKPDVAVADQIGHRAGIYAYRIELAMSGRAADGVTFESEHDAITISVSDVDRDCDLDIIVRHPLSGETIGLWLNDGHGHFTFADTLKLPAAFQAGQTVGAEDTAIDLVPVTSSRRRTNDGLPAALCASPSISPLASSFSRTYWFRSSFASHRTTPRAPPSRFDRLLS